MYWLLSVCSVQLYRNEFVVVVVASVRRKYRHTEHDRKKKYGWKSDRASAYQLVKKGRQNMPIQCKMYCICSGKWPKIGLIQPIPKFQQTNSTHTPNNTQHLLLSTHFRNMASTYSPVSLPNLVRFDATTTCRKSFLATGSFVKRTHRSREWDAIEMRRYWDETKRGNKKNARCHCRAAQSADIVWGQAQNILFVSMIIEKLGQ